MNMTPLIILHQINTITELNMTMPKYGVEVDIRHDNRTGRLYLNHDPGTGDDFEDYLKKFSEQGNKFIIFNIKEAGIEERVVGLASKYNVEDYFLLDVEFPFIFKAASEGKHSSDTFFGLNGRIAIRYSEAEPLANALQFKGIFKWAWTDTITRLPLDARIYEQLIGARYKIALVSPERWGRPDDLSAYMTYMKNEGIKLDAVMTDIKYAGQWENSGVLK